jgi:hypothetical protein
LAAAGLGDLGSTIDAVIAALTLPRSELNGGDTHRHLALHVGLREVEQVGKSFHRHGQRFGYE